MRDFAPVDTDTYPVVKKSFKIAERPILGFSYYYDSKVDRNVLLSVAADSVKTWSTASFGDELDLMLLQEYGNKKGGIRCGTQSYDILPDGKCIIVVDTMNVLHVIKEDENGMLDGNIIDEGMMQILFCRFTPNKEKIFSINFIHGMQSFDFDGQNVTRKKMEKKTSVTAVNFSSTGKYLAIGFETGTFSIFNGETWDICCRVEDIHKKKIRVVEFSHDDESLLIGCDDNTLSLHAVFELTTSKTQTYSYHQGPILAACFDYSKGSTQFCSASADQKVILWDINSGTPIHIFQKCFEEQVVTAVSFSRNGRYLFSGTANGQIVVHKMSTFFEEPPVIQNEDTEMIEENVKEMEGGFDEDEDTDGLRIQESRLEMSEDEDDIGQNMKDFDLSDSDEEEEQKATVKDEEEAAAGEEKEEAMVHNEEKEEETPLSPTETQNGNISGPASVSARTPSEHEHDQNPQSLSSLSHDDGGLNESEAAKSENGDVPMSPPDNE